MSQSANDWASPDASQNMTLADADQFRNTLAGALAVQIAEIHVETTQNQIVSEADLRANQFISPLPVNLYGHLAGSGSADFNLAQFRTNLRGAAAGDQPVSDLCNMLQQMLPGTDVAALLTRMPAFSQAIVSALSKF